MPKSFLAGPLTEVSHSFNTRVPRTSELNCSPGVPGVSRTLEVCKDIHLQVEACRGRGESRECPLNFRRDQERPPLSCFHAPEHAGFPRMAPLLLWLPLLTSLGVSPACESCFLSTPALTPPEDINTHLLGCSCPHPVPQIPEVRQLEHFLHPSHLASPLPDVRLSLFQHRLSLTIKLHYLIGG